jgi:two-component system response regulator FixJ
MGPGTMQCEPDVLKLRVYVIDDDASLRESIALLLSTAGIAAIEFATAEDFLAAVRPDHPACILLDVRLPGMSGLDLLQVLGEAGGVPTVVMITGHGDVPMAVSAMRAGAIHFVEKPFDPDMLLIIVEEALGRAAKVAEAQAQTNDIAARYALLTVREQQVLDLLVEGRPSKLIAYQLGISTRTAEHHRSAVMKKMAVRSLSHLVRMTLDLRRSSAEAVTDPV